MASTEVAVRDEKGHWLPNAPAVHSANQRAVEVGPLTDEQREQIVEICQDGSRGYVWAARSVGVVGTKGQITAMLSRDEDFQEAMAEARRQMLDKAGLSVRRLFEKLGFVVNDDGNHSQLRGIQMGLELQGMRGTDVVHVQHHVEGEVAVVHERRLTLADVIAIAESDDGPFGGAGGDVPVVGEVLAESD